MTFDDQFRAAVKALDAIGAPSALVGGLAVSVRTEPRFTRDVAFDVAVASDAEAERITRALVDAGYSIDFISEHESVGRLATARLRSDEGGPLDLLFASSGIEPELVAAAEPLEVLANLTVAVARAAHLFALKLLAFADDRPQDRGDLQALSAVMTQDDWRTAEEACGLITSRGFARGRDLGGLLRGIRD